MSSWHNFWTFSYNINRCSTALSSAMGIALSNGKSRDFLVHREFSSQHPRPAFRFMLSRKPYVLFGGRCRCDSFPVRIYKFTRRASPKTTFGKQELFIGTREFERWTYIPMRTHTVGHSDVCHFWICCDSEFGRLFASPELRIEHISIRTNNCNGRPEQLFAMPVKCPWCRLRWAFLSMEYE